MSAEDLLTYFIIWLGMMVICGIILFLISRFVYKKYKLQLPLIWPILFLGLILALILIPA